jgi:diacylglycerol kinase (ATP)
MALASMADRKNQPFIARLRFALAGFVHALRAESSVKIQVGALAVVVLTLLILRPSPAWWALVLLASTGVIAAELFNTAVEHLADHLHPEIHPSIRVVKDCAAAAVLVAVLGAVAVGVALVIHLIKN